MTTERSPRLAIQGQESHRHFRISGDGYTDHMHAIGKREHEHLYARLGRVVLSWAQWPPQDYPEYVSERVVPDSIAFVVVGTTMTALVIFVAAYIWWFAR